MLIKRLFLLIIILLMPIFIGGQTPNTIDFLYTWTAPTTGSVVAYYKVYHKIGDDDYVVIGTTQTEQYTIPCVVGETNYVKVSGVDAMEREGMLSVPSEPNYPYVSHVPVDSVGIEPDPIVKSVGCWRAIL